MTTENPRKRAEDEQPEGIKMEDQGASYGSSYNEATPGQTEANRERSLGHDKDDAEMREE